MKLTELVKCLRTAAKVTSVDDPDVNVVIETPNGPVVASPDKVFVCRNTVEISVTISE